MAPAERTQDHLRDPAEIYRRSFALIRAETRLDHLPPALHPLVLRLVHATGTPDLVGDLAFAGDPVAAGRAALAAGATVLVDARMVEAGIRRKALPAGSTVTCTLDAALAAPGTTRSAAAVDLWRPHLEGAVVAIGNAPTALFRLLELLRAGAPLPAVILAFPVGFVGAAESKEALIASGLPLAWVTLRGRRGGSAMAAAAVNSPLSDLP